MEQKKVEFPSIAAFVFPLNSNSRIIIPKIKFIGGGSGQAER